MSLTSDTDNPLIIGGHRYWLVNGRLRPFVAGGADDGGDGSGDDKGGDGKDDGGDAGDKGDGDGKGTGDAGDKGDGDKGGEDDKSDGADDVAKWKALARKHEKQAKANADAAKKLQELEDKDKGELQKANEKAAAAEKLAADANVQLMRHRVAAKTGLPAEMVDRLRGDTEEDMVEDAEALLKVMKPVKGSGSADGGARGDDKPKRARTLEEAVNRHIEKAGA